MKKNKVNWGNVLIISFLTVFIPVLSFPASQIFTSDIHNDAVTYSKIQNVSATNKLLGRSTSGSGDVEEITLGTNLSYTGTTLNAASGSGTPGNPTGLVGLSAVNGSASTYTRSDATHAIDQGITPVWTGAHNFKATLQNTQYSSDAVGATMYFVKARGTGTTTVNNGDYIGALLFDPWGTQLNNTASISALVNGTVSGNSIPTDLVFSTGLTSAIETLRLRSDQTSEFKGSISLKNATSNTILYDSVGVTAPTLTTRGAGTKTVWYPAISGSLVDYATGIDSNTLWNSVPDATSSYQFKWYGKTTELMKLTGDGDLTWTGKAWASYTSTITPNAGTITTENHSFRYTISGKTANFNFLIHITTAGTAAGSGFTFTVPFTPVGDYSYSVREQGVTGNPFFFRIYSGGGIVYGGAITNGYDFSFGGSVEIL